MSEAFARLFSALKVGGYTLKNRIMNTGHGAHFKDGEGIPTERYVAYLRARARGGAGIIVTGHTVPHYAGDPAPDIANFDGRITEVYRRVADATHAYDVPILAQLGHRGRRIRETAFLTTNAMAPSALPAPDFSSPQFMPHAMSTAEVEAVVAAFAAAARRAVEGGMDGVELAIGADFLVTTFLNPRANLRDDRYGGATLAERMTFLDEIMDAIRGELGRTRMFGIRIYEDQVDYSLGLDDYKEVARLAAAGGKVDYFNMWQGSVASPRSSRQHWPPHYYAPGAFAHLSAAIKEVTDLPVVGAGRIDSPALAERLLAEGKLDIIGLARTLIADPDWPEKARTGRTEDIRTCIACTQSCVGHVFIGMGVGCIYNPVTGREAEWGELPAAAARRKVVIVGGGPAGLEAARVAALRGHDVVLFEKARRLGGQVNVLMRAPGREIFEEITLFFERQLRKLGVEVRLGRTATVDAVLAEGADAVVVATGATPFRPAIAGADQAHVVTAWEALAGGRPLGASVLVVDTQGRAEAPSVAEFAADNGSRVEIVTGLEYVGRHMPGPAWHNQIERLLTRGVVLTPFTGVWEIGAGSVDVYNVVSWQPRTIEGVDTVVLAAGGAADDALYRALRDRHPDVRAIGDCYQPRDIEVAVVDGHRVAREL